MSVRNLETLFAPASVAVIGVSDRPGNLGQVVWRNLQGGGFKGPIWLVDSRNGKVGGENTWPDVESLPGVPDLALVCTPAATVPGIIAALGRKGTRAAVVLSAGLKNGNAQDGATLEQAMLDAARPYLLRILGPNCLGVLVPGVGLNASFAPGNALPGKLAFVTQSGALATAMLDWANSRGIGFSHFISLGDSADVDFGDLLDYLASDGGTRAILMYMESVKEARKFMSAARAAARNKPVIVVKAGRAPAGAKAAASHTGALAGSDAVFDAAVRRAGMLRVDTLEALFDAAETLSHVKPWRGERLAMLTNGGGAGVLAADALALGEGRMAELSEATLHALDQCLPPTWPRANPVDVIGDAPVARYCDALRVLLAAPEVDGVLFMHAPTAIVPAARHRSGRPADHQGGGQAGAGLLAGRRHGGGRAQGLQRRRRRQLHHARAGRGRVAAARELRPQPGGAAAAAAGAAGRLPARPGARPGPARPGAARRPRMAGRGAGQDAAAGLRHPGGGHAPRPRRRGGGALGHADRLSGGAEDPVAADRPQVRRGRRGAQARVGGRGPHRGRPDAPARRAPAARRPMCWASRCRRWPAAPARTN